MESPHLASSLLKNGWYTPLFATDVWALSQLMLQLVRGSRPQPHTDLLFSPGFQREMLQPCHDLSAMPAIQAHFSYLSELVSDGQRDYAEQVIHLLWQDMECCKAPAYALAILRPAWSSTSW